MIYMLLIHPFYLENATPTVPAKIHESAHAGIKIAIWGPDKNEMTLSLPRSEAEIFDLKDFLLRFGPSVIYGEKFVYACSNELRGLFMTQQPLLDFIVGSRSV